MTPRERADRAQQILEDAVFKQAVGDIRMRLVAQLESAPISDVETQHEIALMLQLLKRLQAQLFSYVQDNKLDEAKKKSDSWIEKIRERYA